MYNMNKAQIEYIKWFNNMVSQKITPLQLFDYGLDYM